MAGQELTERQKIQRCANFMGWHEESIAPACWMTADGEFAAFADDFVMEHRVIKAWNPITQDEANTQILERLTERGFHIAVEYHKDDGEYEVAMAYRYAIGRHADFKAAVVEALVELTEPLD